MIQNMAQKNGKAVSVKRILRRNRHMCINADLEKTGRPR